MHKLTVFECNSKKISQKYIKNILIMSHFVDKLEHNFLREHQILTLTTLSLS